MHFLTFRYSTKPRKATAQKVKKSVAKKSEKTAPIKRKTVSTHTPAAMHGDKRRHMPSASESSASDGGQSPIQYADSSSGEESFTSLDAILASRDLVLTIEHYYVVKFNMVERNQTKHYVGRLLEIDADREMYSFDFLRKKTDTTFVPLEKGDIAWVSKDNIVEEVVGTRLGTTSRQNCHIVFDTNITKLTNMYYN